MDAHTVDQRSTSTLPLWLGAVIGFFTIFNLLPFLAPVFMKMGWSSAGGMIYMLYRHLCHQMAQRSFFLFGPEGFQMYNIAQLPLDLAGLSGGQRMLALRTFVGNPDIGWKVAWSDRMVYMYLAPLIFAIGYAVIRRFKYIKPLPLWGFVLLLLPMVIDGGTHMLSDMWGIGQGFRYTNEWLAVLTNNVFAPSFYMGDGLGSFNSLMRFISGVTFGLAIVWLAFPAIEETTSTSQSVAESAVMVEA